MAAVAAGLCLFVVALSPPAVAAVGCSLSNPAEDIATFFPDALSFDAHVVTFRRQSPEGWAQFGARLGDDLDPVWETDDVPFSLYVVDGAAGRLGYVFGTNQRGRYSNLQVVVALDNELRLRTVKLQKIRSPVYAVFEDPEFLSSLASLPLATFLEYAPCYRGQSGGCDEVPIQDPSAGDDPEDYRAILRAMAKLQVLAELLLKPGGRSETSTPEALAEWVGQRGGDQSESRGVVVFREIPVTEISPGTEFFAVDGGPGLLLDSWAAGEVAVVDDFLVGRADSGSARVFVKQEGFVLTDQVLFGERLIRDDKTGSLWSLSSGKAVSGARRGEPLKLASGARLRWQEPASLEHKGRRFLVVD